MTKTDDITKTQFGSYVRVQMSGVTNMFDVRAVSALSGLSKDQILTIIKHYDELSRKFGIEA